MIFVLCDKSKRLSLFFFLIEVLNSRLYLGTLLLGFAQPSLRDAKVLCYHAYL